jgi:hypothetical protein
MQHDHDGANEVAMRMFFEVGDAANVNYYSAIVLLAIAHIPGWSAHVIEQWADNRLIRPDESVVGSHRAARQLTHLSAISKPLHQRQQQGQSTTFAPAYLYLLHTSNPAHQSEWCPLAVMYSERNALTLIEGCTGSKYKSEYYEV